MHLSYVYDDVTYIHGMSSVGVHTIHYICICTYVYDDVTYVYDDVTYVYDDVTYIHGMSSVGEPNMNSYSQTYL